MRKGLLRIVAVAAAVVMLLGATAFADGELLKRGKKGEEVKKLQSLLKGKGFFNYDEITGYFGKITEDAVKDYQRSANLKVDGMVGTDTWDSLESEDGNNPSLSTDTSYSEGMEGDDVKKIQERLKALGLYEYDRITGYFGRITERAVKSFQRASDLKDDGVVGSQTWERLFSGYKETSLIPGMKNDDVKALQERLKELGYYTYTVDGSYGSKTKQAVEYFQRAHDLYVDGIAGENTKKVLDSDGAVNEKDARRSSGSNNDTATQPPVQSGTVQGTAAELLDYADNYLGKPYVYAGNGPDGFDCTGFTCFVFNKFGYKLPRTAYDQGYTDYGIKITNPSELQPGDLVFFNTNTSDGDLSDHAGIYISDGKFIHASSGSSMKVVITDMDESSYYTSRFAWGRRVLK